MSKTVTTEDFIRKAKEIHGDKYVYSKVEYINAKTKVCIICPEHGEFWQTPNNHLNGKGCLKCKNDNAKLTTEQFIEKAKKVHGDKYDYSKVEYTGNNLKVQINCPKHGDFLIKPNNHLSGQGCSACAIEKRSSSLKLTTEQFIEKAKKVHGDKYDYSKVEYVGINTKVRIICPEHGEFLQTPNAHLQGHRCPLCARKCFNKS